MTHGQLVAMHMAMMHIEKPEDITARNKLYAGQELDNGDCRALIVACYRDANAVKADLCELAEHFFERYDFDNKVDIQNGLVAFK